MGYCRKLRIIRRFFGNDKCVFAFFKTSNIQRMSLSTTGTCVAARLGDVIEDEEFSSSWSIFPNPASEILKISFDTLWTPTLIELFSLDGNCVIRKVVVTKNAEELSVAELPEGFYFLRASDNSKSSTKRIVVIH
jgi:hypothetical protein